MARKLRIQYPGAIYHVMSRGDRREEIFRDDQDRNCFMDTLDEACYKTGWQVHAWCLMFNHFHLVLETPQANLTAGMKWLLGTYTSRFNRRHKLFGHLFSGRYKAQVVDGSGNGYMKTVCDYVHLNPLRAKLLGSGQKLASYHWSSYPLYLALPRKRPDWLRVDRLLGEHGIPKDSPAGRKEFGNRMQLRALSKESPEALKSLRRGWYVGDKQFRQELLQQMKEGPGEHHYGEEREIVEEDHAERLIREGLNKLGWREEDLKNRKKGDLGKLKLALKLRNETTMTIKWIAARLQMGRWTSLNNLLYQQRNK